MEVAILDADGMEVGMDVLILSGVEVLVMDADSVMVIMDVELVIIMDVLMQVAVAEVDSVR